MTRPRNKYPIESFGPELMTALVKGGKEGLELRFETKTLAHRFQQRVHMLRQRMREESHPDYTVASRAVVSLLWGPKSEVKEWDEDHMGKKGALIRIRPRDSEFGQVLKNAGVTEQEINERDPLADIGTTLPQEYRPLPETEPSGMPDPLEAYTPPVVEEEEKK